ncbi:unnamed protein product [Ceutorhynchus assimilis]|uniref:Uncharacterized protein n=1 Tax=Ceutorhynchus assimilis TaxID=467358 RepID=A0A9P0DI78_9CUCU|nr:unnamed protein product [Ceutorhynchus assimilis]
MLGEIFYSVTALLLIQAMGCSGHTKYDFKIVYEWKQIEYKFASEEERSAAIANGTFDAGRIQPIDAQYVHDAQTGRERVFITTPRIANGVPAALGIVTDEVRDGNPIIDPYPSWSWHLNPEQCNYHRIVSGFRVWADECNRLWVMDDGYIGSDSTCPPQLLAFDLKTDKLLYKYEVPYEQYQNVSSFIAPTAEIEDFKNKCENTWVYVADSVAPSLLVYSLKQNKSWRIQDKSFEPDPNYNTYTIDGDTFEVADGILTVALTPKQSGNRKLYYHSMSNIKESWVYTRHLKNSNNFRVPYGSPRLFKTYKGRRNQQACIEAIDKHGFVYFSLLIDVQIVKWDPRTEYTNKNFHIIANDKETMQFPSGLKIGPYKGGPREALWVFSTAYQRSASGHLNGNEINFRLFFAKL